MPTPARPAAARRGATLAAVALLLAGCGTAPPSPATVATPLRLERPVVLLGEVHDNAVQHAIRAAALRDWIARGARPALVMEMFDRERQPLIDRLRAAEPPVDAATLIARAGGAGWDWAHYRPYVEIALAHGLPLVAANVSRDDARRVIRDGLAAGGFDATVPAPLLDAIAAEVVASHCGMVDAATARRMALAQVARDQAMAAAVRDHADRGVVLLAGNGHVRTDTGVPRWLDAATRSRSESVGLLERGASGRADGVEAARYDRVVATAAAERADPCEAMRRPRAGMPGVPAADPGTGRPPRASPDAVLD